MTAKQIIHELLTSRKTFADAHREDGRRVFQQLVNGVYDVRRPARAQGLVVTLERGGGLIEQGLSQYPDCAQPVVDVEIWYREDGTGRHGAHDVERTYQAMEKMLLGFRGTVLGINVHTISTDSEPFENPERPYAADDQWIHRYTSSWKVCHTRPVAAANTSEYEVR